MKKLLVFAAPSGAGKTTIVRHLLTVFDQLAFSISATTRAPRPYETPGKDYYFIHREAFQQLIDQDAFVEWEEVYEGMFYGTLRTEIERLWAAGKHIIFDIDVKGAMNIKQSYPEQTLCVFVKPPSVEALRKRLEERLTENPETLNRRMARVMEELNYENRFDVVLMNDDLTKALAEAEAIVKRYINPR
ncbi:MAG TPA: guanylate kinase [Saprospiraceae bacterium]|nr:guanylate kinase [Saprospiraceae bacterium]HMQ81696.1 guanylate kinase [Saprospiraceae bacterium]